MSASRAGGLACAIAAAVLGAGCYESVQPLSPPGEVRADGALAGTWRCRPARPDVDESATIRVVLFDEDQLYVEWVEGDEVTRYRAYGSRVGDVTLLNLREVLTKLPPGKWMFVRYRLASANDLTFSLIKDEAVAGKDEAERLAAIRQNVGSETLYTPFAVCNRLAP